MADLSDARANTILDALPTMYIALSSTYPTLAGGNITEPGQSDYVRPAPTFAAASSRARTTTTLADFINGGGAAAGSAGNFSYFAIMTAATSGAMIWRGTLTTPIAWVVGQQVEIAAGNITISFPNT